MLIGNKNFDLENSAYVCGILNVTPDSFSDGGRYNNIDAALFHTEEMIKDGAALIDVGGESTRPGYTMISDDEEIERVVPVIRAVKARFDIPVSLDTYKAGVAAAGIEAAAAGGMKSLGVGPFYRSLHADYEAPLLCEVQNWDEILK